MEELLMRMAESSPVALVAIFSIWRISIVMVALTNALVETAKAQAGNVSDLVEKSQ